MTTLERVRNMTRSEVTKAIKQALQKRTGRTWSVTGSTGTAYMWLKIHAPRNRQVDSDGNPVRDGYGYMSVEDRQILAKALSKSNIHYQGESIPGGTDHWAEYLDRAEGRPVSVFGTRDWD